MMKYLAQLKSCISIPFHVAEQEGSFDRWVRAGLPNGSPRASSDDRWMEGR